MSAVIILVFLIVLATLRPDCVSIKFGTAYSERTPVLNCIYVDPFTPPLTIEKQCFALSAHHLDIREAVLLFPRHY